MERERVALSFILWSELFCEVGAEVEVEVGTGVGFLGVVGMIVLRYFGDGFEGRMLGGSWRYLMMKI